MGNTIPHGDRLHECNATCPEYKNGSMPASIINYQHDDGRNCILGPDDVWRHWDHPKPEPGPRESVEYKCLRAHPEPEERLVDLSSDPPSPLRSQGGSEDYNPSVNDRGDFGMPGLGVNMRDIMDIDNPLHPLRTGRAGVPRYLAGPDAIFMVPSRKRATIDEDGVHFDYGEKGNNIPAQTNQAKRILGDVLPDVMAHFLQRNGEYGEEAHVLGTKGQFADINRKVIKLKRYLWDDVPVPPGAEDIETIATELIGHLLILIDELEQDDA